MTARGMRGGVVNNSKAVAMENGPPGRQGVCGDARRRWRRAVAARAGAGAGQFRPARRRLFRTRRSTSGDPADCALLCERDRRCRSWSFSYPTDVDGGSAVCWLKNTVPPRVPGKLLHLRRARRRRDRAAHRAPSRRRSTAPAAICSNFELKAGDGDEACKAACTADNKCRAFTYARPGYTGREARCFLKKEIKPPRRQGGIHVGRGAVGRRLRRRGQRRKAPLPPSTTQDGRWTRWDASLCPTRMLTPPQSP